VKVVGINASGRTDGNTAVLVNAVLRGGAEVLLGHRDDRLPNREIDPAHEPLIDETHPVVQQAEALGASLGQ